MTRQKEAHLETIRDIQAELLKILDGMDYCLDWKPDPNSWSAREVVYHLLDTPPGGVAAVLRGVFSGTLKAFDLWADRSNMTAARQDYDMGQVKQDIDGFFGDMEEAMAMATEDDLEGRPVLAHLHSRGRDEPRSAKMLLEGLFARHWREHLGQIRALREALGL